METNGSHLSYGVLLCIAAVLSMLRFGETVLHMSRIAKKQMKSTKKTPRIFQKFT